MRLQATDPRRLRAFHVGGYWRGANDMVRQMMLGLRAAGAEVLEYSTDDHPEALDTEGRPYDRGTTGPGLAALGAPAGAARALRPPSDRLQRRRALLPPATRRGLLRRRAACWASPSPIRTSSSRPPATSRRISTSS